MARITAREVFEKLTGKVDPAVVNIVVSIVERQQVQHQQMMACAEAINKMQDLFAQVIQATGGIANDQKKIMNKLGFKNTTSMVESFSEQDDDTGPTTPRS